MEMRLRPGDDVRALWLLVLCVLAGGSFYVQTRYQYAISASHDRTETLYREMVASARVIRDAASLRAVQQRAQADLTRVSRDNSLSGSTANVLETLDASAERFDTRVLEVQPNAAPPDVDKNSAQSKALQATALTVRIRGKFRNILGFVEDLSHHSTLISVSDTELALSNAGEGSAAEPYLDATVHAVLYRLAIPGDEELRAAAAR